MADGTTSARLAQLSAEADRTLRSFRRRTAFFATSSVAAAGLADIDTEATGAEPGTRDTSARPDTPTSRDERGQRALAKEIKRLITEDKRRGLAV